MSERSVQNVRDWVPRFSEYRRRNPVWGSLHIVLEDCNLDDHSVKWCAEYARKQGDDEGEALAQVLLQMSRTQRARLDVLCRELVG